MLIELQPPYSHLYKKGYLYLQQDGRRHVYLCEHTQVTTMTSYARYLVSVHLGYILSDEFEVDHVNDDKTDDRLENFQILTKEQNLLKERLRQMEASYEMLLLLCPQCGFFFRLDGKDYRYRKSIGREFLYCSRQCCLKANPVAVAKDLGTIARIREMRREGATSYKISSDLCISRNTVMKYW